MENNRIYISDELGNEVEMEILFTFELQENNYVVYQKVNASEEDTIYAQRYTNEKLEPITNDEEWGYVEEVIAAFFDMDSDDEQ